VENGCRRERMSYEGKEASERIVTCGGEKEEGKEKKEKELFNFKGKKIGKNGLSKFFRNCDS
jgi:hypothetical protein